MSAGAAAQIEDMCPAKLHQRKNLVDLIFGRLKSLFREHIGIHFRPEVFVFKPFGHRILALLETSSEDGCSGSMGGSRIGSVQSPLPIATHPGQIIAHRLDLKLRD